MVATLDPPIAAPSDPRFTTAIVPTDEAFGSRKYLPGDFKDADNLYTLFKQIIRKHQERFAYLDAFQVDIFWKKKGLKKDGSGICGKCGPISGKQTAYTDGHFRIDIAADACRVGELTRYQMEALMFHELCHTGVTEALKPKMQRHEVEMFFAELEAYGPWMPNLQEAASVFRQAGLGL